MLIAVKLVKRGTLFKLIFTKNSSLFVNIKNKKAFRQDAYSRLFWFGAGGGGTAYRWGWGVSRINFRFRVACFLSEDVLNLTGAYHVKTVITRHIQ